MWGGVERGLAGLKFSGSPPVSGLTLEISSRNAIIISKLTTSFVEKYGRNTILSVLGFIPFGRFDPDW